MGSLNHDTGAISGGGVRPLAPAVFEVAQGGERALNGFVNRNPAQSRHERNAATVVLVLFVVQTDGRSFQEVVPR